MEKIRIAWLLTSAFYYWHPTLSSFSQKFPQMKVFAPKWGGYAPGFENSFAIEVVGKRKIFSLTQNPTGYGASFTYLSFKIIFHLLSYKPKIIFSNSFGMWTIIALLLKPLGKWRVVIAYEGSSPSVDYRNSPVRLAMRQLMVKAADACMTNSQAGKNYLTEILKTPKNQVFVQPYEIPSKKFWPVSKETIEQDKFQLQHPIFLFVGNLIPRKGLDLLLEACAQLQKKGYNNYSLLIVGDGEQRSELENFCQRNALTNCVHWTGRVNYEEIGSYYEKADVFILPTLEDTWGVVVLEAMLMGKTILCSRRAGASEIIKEGENGYCFDPYNIQETAEIMSRFILEPSLAKTMGQKSQEIMTQYSPDAAAQFLTEVTAFVTSPSSGKSKLKILPKKKVIN